MFNLYAAPSIIVPGRWIIFSGDYDDYFFSLDADGTFNTHWF